MVYTDSESFRTLKTFWKLWDDQEESNETTGLPQNQTKTKLESDEQTLPQDSKSHGQESAFVAKSKIEERKRKHS